MYAQNQNMKDGCYKSAKYFKEEFDIGRNTLAWWANEGHVRYVRLSEKGRRKYLVDDVIARIKAHAPKEESGRDVVLYARVSSSKQREDLERQVQTLRELYPAHTRVVTDIGSGVHFRRQGLCTLLEDVYRRKVSKIVVLYKDRAARIGADLLEHVLEAHGATLVVLREDTKDDDGEHDDLVAVVTSFVASHHGRRAARNKRARTCTSTEDGARKRKQTAQT